jgi:hypothetical protein
VCTHISIDKPPKKPWSILFFFFPYFSSSVFIVFLLFLILSFFCSLTLLSLSLFFSLQLCCVCCRLAARKSRVFAGWLKSSFPSFAISLRSSYLSLQCDRRLPFFCLLLSCLFPSLFFSFPSLFFPSSLLSINKTESLRGDASQRPKESSKDRSSLVNEAILTAKDLLALRNI